MIADSINNFLLSLTVAIAGNASLSLTTVAPGRQIAYGEINESSGLVAPVYTVLRSYPGMEQAAFPSARVLSVRAQLDTRGADNNDVLKQAWKAHEGLIDPTTQCPRTHWQFAGKKFDSNGEIAADGMVVWEVRIVRFLTAPGILGRDEQDRHIASSNFEVDFQQAA